MASETVIRVQDLAKRYILPHRQVTPSGDGFRHVIQDFAGASLRALGRRLRGPRADVAPPGDLQVPSTEEFWALKNVSFHVKRGEVLGIIGRNGAGKSTLLKILSRITEPTSGGIGIKGRVASLLEVGTGFHPELTGRENIFLNGAILGMRRAEVRAKFDEIVDFAEVERFLDTPVKHYSSGMYVRLAFAVAAHLEPEVLIIDEVLAVGDAAFQKKCLGKVKTVSAQEGRTVIFVSHQMGVVSAICERCVVLEKGEVVADGDVKTVIPLYLKSGASQSGEVRWNDRTAPQNERVRFRAVRLTSAGQVTNEAPLSSPIMFELEFEALVDGLSLNVSFHLLDRIGNCILATANLPSATLNQDQWGTRPHARGRYRSACEIPPHFLNEDRYSISAFVVSNASQIEAMAAECLSFQTYDTGEMRREATGGWIGVIRPKFAWSTQRIGDPSHL